MNQPDLFPEPQTKETIVRWPAAFGVGEGVVIGPSELVGYVKVRTYAGSTISVREDALEYVK